MSSPDTVVLVHGLWMTPRSWEEWVPYLESKGYRVLTPGYPGFEVEVEALREDPSVISSLTVPQTVAHLAEAITDLEKPPIIIGHSFGGTLTQLLLDRGCGAAGVVIDSAPTEGVRVNPPSQIKSLWPFLKNPANRHKPVGFTPEEFHKNDSRAPLLFIAGGEDHIMPPAVNRSNAKHYKSETVTDYHEFPGRSHWTCAEDGWEEVADFALEWASAHAREPVGSEA